MDRQTLARATEGTDAPTPGYLYVDLAKAATANPTACHDMAVYLTRRLSNKQNPNIKMKCCKVIAKLCEQVPRNQFRRTIAQDPNAVGYIKEAMNFRGPLDPVQGDTKNEKVRQAAKEALDQVYAETPSSDQVPYGGSSSTSMSASYGPSVGGYGAGGGYGGSSAGAGGRRMEGIGNPRYQDPRNDPRYNGTQQHNIKEVVKEAGEVVMGMIKDPLARNVEVAPRQGHSGNLPGYGNPSYGRPPPGASELSRQTGGQWTMASNRGPAAIGGGGGGGVQQDEYYKSRDSGYQWAQQQKTSSTTSGGVGGSWANPSVASQAREPPTTYNSRGHSTPSITIQSTGGGGGTAVSDGSYEKNLVLELCPPGGLKPVPPPDKLANFARNVSSLNPDLICPVLLDCLEDGQPWIIRAKALCVMEVCIQNGGKDGQNAYESFFHACREEIAPLVSHPRPAIRDPARRVLQLLGVDAPDASTGPAPQAAPPVAAAPNLLDFDDEPAPAPTSAPPPPPPAAASPAPAPPAGDMFGGMQVKSKTPASNGTAKVEPAPASGTLLDFMGDSPAPAPANDVFSAQDAPNAASMFSEMNLKEKGETKESQSADKSAATTNGSAATGSSFGFINESAPKEAPPHPSSHPSTDSYDPLMNMTPNTAQRKTMQLSQEQMQAMAYQQMMYQQQMQQQMQQMSSPQMQQMSSPQMQQMLAMQQQQQMMAMQRGQQPMPMYMMGASKPGANPAATSGFSFVDARPQKKDDKKFDFVKDAMQANKK